MELCSFCGKKEADRICAVCEQAAWCSDECRHAHWESGEHVEECEILGDEMHPVNLQERDFTKGENIEFLLDCMHDALIDAAADELEPEEFIEWGHHIADQIVETSIPENPVIPKGVRADVLQDALEWLSDYHEGAHPSLALDTDEKLLNYIGEMIEERLDEADDHAHPLSYDRETPLVENQISMKKAVARWQEAEDLYEKLHAEYAKYGKIQSPALIEAAHELIEVKRKTRRRRRRRRRKRPKKRSMRRSKSKRRGRSRLAKRRQKPKKGGATGKKRRRGLFKRRKSKAKKEGEKRKGFFAKRKEKRKQAKESGKKKGLFGKKKEKKEKKEKPEAGVGRKKKGRGLFRRRKKDGESPGFGRFRRRERPPAPQVPEPVLPGRGFEAPPPSPQRQPGYVPPPRPQIIPGQPAYVVPQQQQPAQIIPGQAAPGSKTTIVIPPSATPTTVVLNPSGQPQVLSAPLSRSPERQAAAKEIKARAAEIIRDQIAGRFLAEEAYGFEAEDSE